MSNVVSIHQARMQSESEFAYHPNHENGWYKAYRSMYLDDSPLATMVNHSHVWNHLLARASHQPHWTTFLGKRVLLQPGELIIGRKTFSQQTGVSEQSLRTILTWFENEGMIARESSHGGTLVRIVNHGRYQGFNTNQPSTSLGNQGTNQSINQPKASSGAALSEMATSQPTCQPTTPVAAKSTTIQDNNISTDTNVSVVDAASATPTVELGSHSSDEVETTAAPVQPKAKAPACPHLEIIAAYHELLPELRTVIESRWDGQRRTDLATRWKEDPRHQSLEFWRRFFTKLRDFPWYLGENDRGWKADLGWVVKRRNFDSLLEKFISDTNAKRNGGHRNA